jgi:hypothetical protein
MALDFSIQQRFTESTKSHHGHRILTIWK